MLVTFSVLCISFPKVDTVVTVICRYCYTVLPERCNKGSSRCLTMGKCGFCGAKGYCKCDLKGSVMMVNSC